MAVSEHTIKVIAALNEKFPEKEFACPSARGRKFDKIICQNLKFPGWMSYLFVKKDDGGIYKSGGMRPFVGDGTYPEEHYERYNVSTDDGFDEFIRNADQFGSFLYEDYTKK